jgi:UDP-galactopyranose mutase
MQSSSKSATSIISDWKVTGAGGATLICFSHLRWDFVFQRPQHLMARFAVEGAVIFWEEPRYDAGLPKNGSGHRHTGTAI